MATVHYDFGLITSLIDKIFEKLPVNSNHSIDELLMNNLFAGNVGLLIELSKYRLVPVTKSLSDTLHSLARTVKPNEDTVPLPLVNSLIIILNILNECFANCHRFMQQQSNVGIPSPRSIYSQLSSCQDLEEDKIAFNIASILPLKSHSSLNDSRTKMPMLKTRNSSFGLIWESVILDPQTALTILDSAYPVFSFVVKDQVADKNMATPLFSSTPSYTSTTNLEWVNLHQSVSRLISFVSSSCWDSVFVRIKTKLLTLANSNEEFPDLTDIKLIEHCNLDSTRLSTLLQAVIESFKTTKKLPQYSIASTLRKTIWSWIEVYPEQFVSLFSSDQNFQLQCDLDDFFDFLRNLGEQQRKRALFWPLQAMMLMITPHSLKNDIHTTSSKVSFLMGLKKSLRNPKLATPAAISCVDICKACGYLTECTENPFMAVVADIEPELKAILFDPQKPFYMPINPSNVPGQSSATYSAESNYIDYPLMTECMTALFKLDFKGAFEALVPICLQENALPGFKLTFVRSCLNLVKENPTSWYSKTYPFYFKLAKFLREFFQSNFYRDKSQGDISQTPQKDRRMKVGFRASTMVMNAKDEFVDKQQITFTLLSLWDADPILAIANDDSNLALQDTRALMYGICFCLNDLNSEIQEKAADALYKLHDSKLIRLWGVGNNIEDRGSPEWNRLTKLEPNDVTYFVIKSFWLISSQNMTFVARRSLELKDLSGDNDQKTKFILGLLNDLFKKRYQFLTLHKEVYHFSLTIHERISSLQILETVILILLCSANSEICAMAVQSLEYLCDEIILTGESTDDTESINISEASTLQDISMIGTNKLGRKLSSGPIPSSSSKASIAENVNVYMELAKHWKTGTITGRVAQQKKIRRMFLSIKKANISISNAWEEGYRRWKQLTQILIKFSLGEDSVTEREKHEWQNYTGFLCSLGGACLKAESREPRISAIPESVRNKFSPANTVPQNVAIFSGLAPHRVENYVQELVDLLICEDVFVREVSKDCLGSDISPELYEFLLRGIELGLSKLCSSEGVITTSEKNTLFAEQTIGILRLLLERIVEALRGLDAVDFSGLFLSLTRYCHHLGTDWLSLRVKIKHCQLLEIMVQKRELITLKQEIFLRNTFVGLLLDWISDFTMDNNNWQTDKSNQSLKLQNDLDQACIRCIVNLLSQLPLQPDMYGAGEMDVSEAKSRLFYKYFSFLTKILNRCRVLEAASHNRDTMVSKEMIKDMISLKENTTLALSNLLSANVESGLKYSLTMGYHEDTQIRTAFIQVLSNILNQGTEFEGLGENTLKSRYSQLVELITEPKLSIVLALRDSSGVSDVDELAPALFALFEAQQSGLHLIEALINKEIHLCHNLNNVESAQNLFRGNSLTTKIMTLMTKKHGAKFLVATLQPIFQEYLSGSGLNGTEIDPAKLQPLDDREKNIAVVKDLATKFIEAILASAATMPEFIKRVNGLLATAVTREFPEIKAHTIISGYIFLRFFCPAIVSPTEFGIVREIDSNVRKTLIYVTKILQNLGNNILFGSKESYMIEMNDVLKSYSKKVEIFLNEICSFTPEEENETMPSEIVFDESDIAVVYRYLFKYSEKIMKDITYKAVSLPPVMEEEGFDEDAIMESTYLKRCHEKLSSLFDRLGQPVEQVRHEILVGKAGEVLGNNNNQLYAEFMTKNENRNVDSIKERKIFFKGEKSLKGRTVLYYVARRVIAESIDIELLMLYILMTLKPCFSEPYEIVMDMTQFGSQNEIQIQWIRQFLQIIPSDASANLSAIYIYNPNGALKRYVKRLPRSLISRVEPKCYVMTSLNELGEFINKRKIRLPKFTMSIEDEISACFSPVMRVTNYRQSYPSVIKISKEAVQITSLKAQEIFGKSALINEVLPLDDLTYSVDKYENDQFTLKFNRGKTSMTLESNKRDQIILAIQSSQARLKLSNPVEVAERIIRPNDVPGTVLNIALLNLSSGDPGLRTVAYDLLYQLSMVFNFAVGNELLKVTSLSIPANSIIFVQAISEKLASTEIHLTLEFLTECIVGWYKSTFPLKQVCLQYMSPWLSNLAFFCRKSITIDNESFEKTNAIFKSLVDISVKETELFPAIQTHIWQKLAQVPELVPLLLETLLNYANENGIGSNEAEVVASTIITFASVNNDYVPGKIVAKLRKAILKTAKRPMDDISDHAAWKEIGVLSRICLTLSFKNLLNVSKHLPELLHIICLLVGTGSSLIRSSIHSLAINIIHSLCTTTSMDDHTLRNLTLIANEFSEPKFSLLFGVNRRAPNPFVVTKDVLNDKLDRIPLSSLETIANTFLEVMELGGPTAEISNIWRSRWMSLMTSAAFQFNPSLQPRAFVVLGCLAKEEIDDDLLFQILVALIRALTAMGEDDCDLIVSIVMFLSNIVENLPVDSIYLQPMFWVAISLLQLSHIKVFSSALSLLYVVLTTLYNKGLFSDEPMANCLLKGREPIDDVALALDIAAGIHFKSDFALAVTATVLKGLKHPTTKASTFSVLMLFLEIACKSATVPNAVENKTIPISNLYYLLPLLVTSTETEQQKNLLWMVGFSNVELNERDGVFKYHGIFEKIDMTNNDEDLFWVALIVTMLHSAEYETEFLVLFRFLAEVSIAIPDTLLAFYEQILPKMSSVITSSQNTQTIEAVNLIIQHVLRQSIDKPFNEQLVSKRKYAETLLSDRGFDGLMMGGSFQSVTLSRMKRRAQIASEIVEKIL